MFTYLLVPLQDILLQTLLYVHINYTIRLIRDAEPRTANSTFILS